MAGKNWQAGSKDLIPARGLLCAATLACSAAPVCLAAPAWAGADGFSPATYLGSLDPNVLWELLIGGIVVCAFITSVALWLHSSMRRFKRAQARRNTFVN